MVCKYYEIHHCEMHSTQQLIRVIHYSFEDRFCKGLESETRTSIVCPYYRTLERIAELERKLEQVKLERSKTEP